MAEESITSIFAPGLTSQKILGNIGTTENYESAVLRIHNPMDTSRMILWMENAKSDMLKNHYTMNDPDPPYSGLNSVYRIYFSEVDTYQHGSKFLPKNKSADKMSTVRKVLPKLITARLAATNEITNTTGDLTETLTGASKLLDELDKAQNLQSIYTEAQSKQLAIMDVHKTQRYLFDFETHSFIPEIELKVLDNLHKIRDPTIVLDRILYRVIAVGDLLFFISSDNLFAMMKHHYARMLQMITAIGNIKALCAMNYPNLDTVVIIRRLLNVAQSVSKINPSAVPLVFKGARALCIANMSEDNFLFDDPVRAFAETFGDLRTEWSVKIHDLLKEEIPDKVPRVNFCNIFKAFIHPDTHLYRVFEGIKDIRTPNIVEYKLATRFKHTFRREMFNSMRANGMDVRLEMSDPVSQPSKLMISANESKAKFDQMKVYGISDWYNVKIARCREIPESHEVEIPISSKSSSKEFKFTASDLLKAVQETKDQAKVSEENPFSTKSTVNDVVSTLKGEATLGGEYGIKEFKRLITEHEKFERESGYKTPEDIPPETLADFVENNPKARYLVCTEPKWGEKHKIDPRLFYMASQKMKSMTQMTERIVKNCTLKQAGVSITKSFRDRRRDLERMCRLMGSSVLEEGGIVDEARYSLFISFDMEKFSKRFPMRLVRMAGEVLAEITGEEAYKRLDIVFRSATVIHNTRGFFNHLSGIKGGFEGFLNFLWTSIHAVIMRVALEVIGQAGDLLAFSDDGLLRILIPRNWSRERVKQMISELQGVYRRFGLEFNLAKVFISSSVWEYLGDVAYQCKLVPMWIKEASSLGLLTTGKGLNPSYLKVQMLEGQADSLVASGCSALTVFILKHIYYILHMTRFIPKDRVDIFVIMSVLPPSFSGHRTRNYMEMCMSANFDPLTVVGDDLVSIKSMFPTAVERVVAGIIDQLLPIENPVKAMISGFLTNYSGPKCSGQGVIRQALTRLQDKLGGRVVPDPFSTANSKKMNEFIMETVNIDVSIFRTFLMSSPEWTNYNESVAMIRSSAAIGLLGRKLVRGLQKADTITVERSVNHIERLISLSSLTIKGDPSVELTIATDRVCLKDLSVSLTRLSHLSILRNNNDSLSDNEGVISNKVVYNAKYPSSEVMAEPRLKYAGGMTSLGWSWELKRLSADRHKRNVMSTAASMIARFPDSMSFIRGLLQINGYDVPPALYDIQRNLSRRGLTHSFDANIRSTSFISKIIKTSYTTNGYMLVKSRVGVDKALPLVLARALTQYRLESRLLNYNTSVVLLPAITYEFTELARLVFVYPQVMNLKDPTKRFCPFMTLTDEYTRSFIEAYKEALSSANMLESIESASMSGGIYKTEEEAWIMSRAIEKGANWLRTMKDRVSLGNYTFDDFPISPVFTATCIVSSCMRNAISYVDKRSLKILWDSVKGRGSKIPTSIQKLVMERYNSNCQFVIDILLRGDLRNRVASLYQDPSTASATMAYELYKLCDLDFLKKYIMKSHNTEPASISQSEASSIRKIFTAFVSHLYEEGKQTLWNDPKVASARVESHDRLLDVATAAESLIRPSEHRSILNPYNKKMARIEVMKMYTVASRYFNMYVKRVTLGNVPEPLLPATFHLNEREQQLLEHQLNDQGLGEDHRRALKQPILPKLFDRLQVYARAYAIGYSRAHNPKIKKCKDRMEWLNSMKCDSANYAAMNNAFTELYNLFTDGLVRHAIFIDTDVEKAALNDITPRVRPTIPLCSVVNRANQLYYSKFNLTVFRNYRSQNIQKLMKHHLTLLKLTLNMENRPVYREGNISRAISSDEAEDPIDIIIPGETEIYDMGKDQPAGFTATLKYCGNSETLKTPLNLSLVFSVSQKPHELASDYALINSLSTAALSIFFEPQKSYYILCGCFAGGYDYLKQGHNMSIIPPIVDGDGVSNNLSQFFETMSIAQASDAVWSDTASIRSLSSISDSRNSAVFGSKLEGVSYFGDVRVVVNNSDALLQAIAEAIQSDPSSAQSHAYYIAFLYWATHVGATTVTGLEYHMEKFSLVLRDLLSDNNHRKSYQSYTGAVMAWFSQFTLTAGESLDMELLSDYRNSLNCLTIDLAIHPKCVLVSGTPPVDFHLEYTQTVVEFVTATKYSVTNVIVLFSNIESLIFPIDDLEPDEESPIRFSFNPTQTFRKPKPLGNQK